MNPENISTDDLHHLTILHSLGADDIGHLDGSLLEHLVGTKYLLHEWGASDVYNWRACITPLTALQVLTKPYAVWKTVVESNNCWAMKPRLSCIAMVPVIGIFFQNIQLSALPEYRDWFAGTEKFLSASEMKNFCELTAANHTQIALGSGEFICRHGDEPRRLFQSMEPYLSAMAVAATKRLFG